MGCKQSTDRHAGEPFLPPARDTIAPGNTRQEPAKRAGNSSALAKKKKKNDRAIGLSRTTGASRSSQNSFSRYQQRRTARLALRVDQDDEDEIDDVESGRPKRLERTLAAPHELFATAQQPTFILNGPTYCGGRSGANCLDNCDDETVAYWLHPETEVTELFTMPHVARKRKDGWAVAGGLCYCTWQPLSIASTGDDGWERLWFYNDSPAYAMYITYYFGPDSRVQRQSDANVALCPLPRDIEMRHRRSAVKVEAAAFHRRVVELLPAERENDAAPTRGVTFDGSAGPAKFSTASVGGARREWFKAQMVLYPGETKALVMGLLNGYDGSVTAELWPPNHTREDAAATSGDELQAAAQQRQEAMQERFDDAEDKILEGINQFFKQPVDKRNDIRAILDITRNGMATEGRDAAAARAAGVPSNQPMWITDFESEVRVACCTRMSLPFTDVTFFGLKVSDIERRSLGSGDASAAGDPSGSSSPRHDAASPTQRRRSMFLSGSSGSLLSPVASSDRLALPKLHEPLLRRIGAVYARPEHLFPPSMVTCLGIFVRSPFRHGGDRDDTASASMTMSQLKRAACWEELDVPIHATGLCTAGLWTGVAALLRDDPSTVARAFLHPRDPGAAVREQRVGAFRVTINDVLSDGTWRHLILDSFVPQRGKTPAFTRHMTNMCDYWPLILEKAFAKQAARVFASVGSVNPFLSLSGSSIDNIDTQEAVGGPFGALLHQRLGRDSLSAIAAITGYPCFTLRHYSLTTASGWLSNRLRAAYDLWKKTQNDVLCRPEGAPPMRGLAEDAGRQPKETQESVDRRIYHSWLSHRAADARRFWQSGEAEEPRALFQEMQQLLASTLPGRVLLLATASATDAASALDDGSAAETWELQLARIGVIPSYSYEVVAVDFEKEEAPTPNRVEDARRKSLAGLPSEPIRRTADAGTVKLRRPWSYKFQEGCPKAKQTVGVSCFDAGTVDEDEDDPRTRRQRRLAAEAAAEVESERRRLAPIPIEDNQQDLTVSWMDFLRCFHRIGFSLLMPDAFDYRVRGRFSGSHPDLSVRITVRGRESRVVFLLTQSAVDPPKGAAAGKSGARRRSVRRESSVFAAEESLPVSSGIGASQLCPIALVGYKPHDTEPGKWQFLQCSTARPWAPEDGSSGHNPRRAASSPRAQSPTRPRSGTRSASPAASREYPANIVFQKVKQVAMILTLTPVNEPYVVVPLRHLVPQPSDVNSPTSSELNYTLTLLTPRQATTNESDEEASDSLRIDFVSIPPDCKVLEHGCTFDLDGGTEREARYQRRFPLNKMTDAMWTTLASSKSLAKVDQTRRMLAQSQPLPAEKTESVLKSCDVVGLEMFGKSLT